MTAKYRLHRAPGQDTLAPKGFPRSRASGSMPSGMVQTSLTRMQTHKQNSTQQTPVRFGFALSLRLYKAWDTENLQPLIY